MNYKAQQQIGPRCLPPAPPPPFPRPHPLPHAARPRCPFPSPGWAAARQCGLRWRGSRSSSYSVSRVSETETSGLGFRIRIRIIDTNHGPQPGHWTSTFPSLTHDPQSRILRVADLRLQLANHIVERTPPDLPQHRPVPDWGEAKHHHTHAGKPLTPPHTPSKADSGTTTHPRTLTHFVCTAAVSMMLTIASFSGIVVPSVRVPREGNISDGRTSTARDRFRNRPWHARLALLHIAKTYHTLPLRQRAPPQLTTPRNHRQWGFSEHDSHASFNGP